MNNFNNPSGSLEMPQKVNALRGLSMKMKSPQASMSMFKSPKLPGIGARVKREVDPDYLPHHKLGLTSKLY